MNRYVIVGSGVAGKRAAEVIRKRDAGGEVVMLEPQPDPFFSRPMLGELIAGGRLGEDLAVRDRQKLDALGVDLRTGVTVTGLDTDARKVLLAGGEGVPFDKLLIASGIRTARPEWAGAGAEGVACLDNLSDARAVDALVSRAGKAVIFGASFQALNALRALRKRGVACTLLLEEDRFLCGVLDRLGSEILEERIGQEGVTVLKGTGIRELKVSEGVLRAVVTRDGEEIPAGLLVVAGPQRPSAEFLGGAVQVSGAGVVVDAELRTSADGVFAAGDVVRLPGRDAPKPGWLRAWRQGGIAGTNMTGGAAAFGWPSAFRTKALGIDVVCLGLSDPDGHDVQQQSGGYPYEEMPHVYKNLVFQGGRIAGAVFLGDVSEAGAVEGWIRRDLDRDQCDSKVIEQMFTPRVRELTALGALCPMCKFQIQLGEGTEDGTTVTCPACGLDYKVHRMPNGVFRAEPVG